MAHFYCKKITGEGFDIDEWNDALKFCNDAGIEGEARDKILSPELFPCDTQCESCINTVIDTNRKYKIKTSHGSKIKP